MIAVGVFEDGGSAPLLGLGWFGEGDAFGFEDLGGGKDVVTPEGDGLKLADAIFMALRSEEGEASVGSGDGQLDPALFRSESLVGEDFAIVQAML